MKAQKTIGLHDLPERREREREREGMRTVHSVDRTVSHSAMRNGRF